jgi:ATP-dependent helicase HrpA
MKSLPQRLRSQLVPLPESVTAFLDEAMKVPGMQDLSTVKAPLVDVLMAYLNERRTMAVRREDFDTARLPVYLTMNVRVVDADGQELTMSRDFTAIRAEFAEQSRTVFSTLHSNRLEKEGVTRWSDIPGGELPEAVNFEKNRVRYDGFPALIDRGASVAVEILDDKESARQAHREGLARLMILENHEQTRFIAKGLRISPVAAFQYAHYFPETKNHTQDAMREELTFAAVATAFVDRWSEVHGPIRSAESFNAAKTNGKSEIGTVAPACAKSSPTVT